jgi:hypothetical protein
LPGENITGAHTDEISHQVGSRAQATDTEVLAVASAHIQRAGIGILHR